MENASKALLIAGGMLLAILLVTLLVYAWGMFSEYQNAKADLAEIEDTAKFNEQLSQYDRDDVDGYTLLSLINRIVDYNERNTTDSVSEQEKYPAIILTIKLGKEPQRQALTYDGTNRLFTQATYAETELSAKNRKDDTSLKNVIDNAFQDGLKTPSGTTLDTIKAEKVARSIASIFKTAVQIDADAKRQYGVADATTRTYVYKVMINEYNTASGESLTIDDINELIIPSTPGSINSNEYYTYACQYYEYMQFKRGIFKCTNLEYSDESSTGTGRISKMDFEFTGTIN